MASDPGAQEQARLAREYQESTEKSRGDREGVVVTPLEVVEFINASAENILHSRYDRELSGPGIEIIDPFAGTGIFFARMLQNAPRMQVQGMVNNMYGLEIDPVAAKIADENVKNVARQCGATPPARPVVICADTFSIPPEQSIPELFDEVLRTGTHPYMPKEDAG